jgi:hypothetical protein
MYVIYCKQSTRFTVRWPPPQSPSGSASSWRGVALASACDTWQRVKQHESRLPSVGWVKKHEQPQHVGPASGHHSARRPVQGRFIFLKCEEKAANSERRQICSPVQRRYRSYWLGKWTDVEPQLHLFTESYAATQTHGQKVERRRGPYVHCLNEKYWAERTDTAPERGGDGEGTRNLDWQALR